VGVAGLTLLTVNAGSSSTKCSVLDEHDETLARLDLPPAGDPTVPQALARLVADYSPEASVHRLVHGGTRWHRAVMVDPVVAAELASLDDLAPLHNPPGRELIEAVRVLAPDLPAVACFDTAYFADLPEAAATYAVPAAWRENLGIRRYGFHGLSHAWAVRRAAALLDRETESLRIVTAHLGAGASLAATAAGRPLDTTMGFTPLEGLVMATRPGTVDPGALVEVLRRGGMSLEELSDALEHRSGLLSLAGTPDLAEVIAAAGRGERAGSLAYGVYLHRLVGSVGAMVGALGGVDLLVFTGGAGEASSVLRRDVCGRLAFLGLSLDPRRNQSGDGDRLISSGEGPNVAVVHAREDLEMARQARSLLGTAGPAPIG